jgi:hypothetical protein
MATSNNPIDALQELRARIQEMEVLEAALRDEIIAFGVGVHRGTNYDAVITIAPRKNYDNTALRKLLPKDVVEAHVSFSQITTVKIVERAA